MVVQEKTDGVVSLGSVWYDRAINVWRRQYFGTDEKRKLEKTGKALKTAFKLREDWGGKRQGNPLEQIEKNGKRY